MNEPLIQSMTSKIPVREALVQLQSEARSIYSPSPRKF
jgi:hypothetical protein